MANYNLAWNRLNINEGDKFNMLTIIKLLPNGQKPSGQTYRRVLSKCDCGKEVINILSKIVSGKTKSCGCFGKTFHITHGKSKHSIYRVWCGMLSRCKNKNNIRYKFYGGKGIRILWKSFEEFYNDMGNEYQQGLLIDRIDNNGNYCKENCRWTDIIVSNNNTSHNKFLEFNGKKLTYRKWDNLLKFRIGTVRRRYVELKWSIEKTLTSPKKINQYK